MTLTRGSRAGAHNIGVSVIIPAYRAAGTLSECLESVCAQELERPFEVIVVDSSADGSEDEIRARFPLVQVVSLPVRTAAGAARNAGARKARGEVLAFLDADCSAPPGWLARLVSEQEAHGGVVGGSVAPRPPHDVVGLFVHALLFSQFMPGRPRALVPYVPSCNLAVGRERFLELGGFEEDLLRTEDMAFGVRANGAGESVLFAPDVVVAHAQRTSLREGMRHQWASGYWSARLRRSRSLSTSKRMGAWLVRVPYLIPLLVPYRFLAIGLRLALLRRERWLSLLWLGLWPLSLTLLGAFAAGFTVGAKS